MHSDESDLRAGRHRCTASHCSVPSCVRLSELREKSPSMALDATLAAFNVELYCAQSRQWDELTEWRRRRAVGREALGERGELVGAEMAVQGSTAEVMVGMAVSEAEATVKAVRRQWRRRRWRGCRRTRWVGKRKDLDLSQIQVAISSRCSPLDKDVRVTPSAVATPNHVRLCSVGIRRCVRPAAVVRASSLGLRRGLANPHLERVEIQIENVRVGRGCTRTNPI